MIHPSHSLSPRRLLASGRLSALLFATALSPLALPLLPDHGQIGIVAAQAQQRVAIDKIEIPLSTGGSVVINNVAVNGSSLAKAEIEDLFKPKSVATTAGLLQRFNAESMTIGSISLLMKSDIQDVLTVYETLETGKIRAGAVESLTIKSGKQTGKVKGDQQMQLIDTVFGRFAVETVDLTGIARWLMDSDPSGKAPMKKLHGRYELASMDMKIDQVKITVGKVVASGFEARLARKPPMELIALAEATGRKSDDPKAALPFMTAFLDLYSGISFGEGSVEGFTIVGKDPKTGSDFKGSGGKMSFVGGANPNFVFNDFAVTAADGFLKFKKVGFEGDAYAWLMGGIAQMLQGEAAGKPGAKPDPEAEQAKAMVAEISKGLQQRDMRFVFEGLDADLPPAKGAKSPDRVKMALGALDLRMGGFVGMVPTKVDYALNGFRMPVPANSKDQGLQTLRELGIDVLDISARIKGTWDEGKTRFVVDDVNTDMAKMAKVGMKAEIGNIPKPLFENPMTAWTYTLLGANAQSLSLGIENRGGLDKLIAKAAKDQKKTPDQFKMELSAIAPAMIGMYLGGHPDGPALSDALTKFIRNPGAINITLRAKSPGGLTAMELMAAGENPGALMQKVKIDVDVK